MDKKCCSGCSLYSMVGSVAAVVLAAIGWLGIDVWLASTQWMLVAIVLGVYGLWFKLEK